MEYKDFLTPYENRIFIGINKTKADLLKDDKMVANTLKECLGVDIPCFLETGEEIQVPLLVQLIALKLNYWKTHPNKIDLKELSTVLGETKMEQIVKVENASDIFKGISVKK